MDRTQALRIRSKLCNGTEHRVIKAGRMYVCRRRTSERQKRTQMRTPTLIKAVISTAEVYYEMENIVFHFRAEQNVNPVNRIDTIYGARIHCITQPLTDTLPFLI
ncbi:hypothetical protein CRM22_010284, partial [Opisthorchis felineus]